MLIVEVHSNDILTIRDGTFACAVSDSKKHETVKFLFPKSWGKYLKTAVFSADGVEPINILLDPKNPLCISKDECYIPFEVLKGDSFILSVFGEKDSSLATTTRVSIEVLESGYALGDEPQIPTPDQYSQILNVMRNAELVAQSVRNDADAGLFKGEKGDKGDTGPQGERGAIGPKGDKGEKGDKGDDYTLTEVDKKEIAGMVDVSDVDISRVAPSITSTINGGKFLTVNDVSPIAHKCSLILTSDRYESANIYEFNSDNMEVTNVDDVSCTFNENGTVIINGAIPKDTPANLLLYIYTKDLDLNKDYTVSVRNSDKILLSPTIVMARDENGNEEQYYPSGDSYQFTPTEAVDHYVVVYYFTGTATEDPFFNYFRNETIYPQLELGTKVTEWQEYGGISYIEDFSTVKVNVNGAEYIPNADGIVTDIESFSSTMEITTNNEHVNICDFTYCVDTKKYVDEALSYVDVDLSEYAKLEDIENKADKSEIPTKVSQLINDSGYITEHQSLEGFATEPYVDSQVARIEGNLSSEIAVERARINTFTVLENGSTTGDAELQDIRVGADGTVYESAGASVRGQIDQINDVVFYDEIEKDITDTLTIENGYYYGKSLQKLTQNGLACTNIIPVKSGDKFKITAKYGYYAVLVAEFDTSNTMISYTGQVDGQEIGVTDYEYTVPNGVSGIAVSTRDTRYNPIKVIKIAKDNVKNRIKTLEDLSELSLVATNQVVDKSEWTATGGALTFGGGTAIVTADKSNTRVGVNAKFGECKNGDTLFFKANIKAPWGVGGTISQNIPDVNMYVNTSTGLKYVVAFNTPLNGIEHNDYYGNIAFDCDVNGIPLLCSVMYNNVNVIPTNAQIEVKDIVVVNLTKVFGAGNEPTAEEFYSLLNCFENKYFEGEKNLFSASANLRRIYNDYKSTLLTEDITVTVGANGDFETLNGAISYLSSFYPAYKKGGIKCYIKILEGTVINEQIFANQIDLQYITIIAEGNTETINIDGTSYTMNIVDVNATGFKHTANAHDARGNYPFIAGENAAKLPTIGCVFRLMPETVEEDKTICGMLCNRGSEGVVLAASGFDGFNDGVIANNESSITIREGISRNMTRWGVHARHNGEVSARSCVCTNCGIGACADRVADCDVREAVLNGSKVAIECNNISRVNANGCHAQNCGTNGGYVVMISGGGFANCGSLDTTGYVGTLYNTATNTLSAGGIVFV